jgi:CBS domain-containing protein
MQVGELMTANPACCTPDSTLQEVARMMEQNDCGCIPVVNSLSDKKPVGTITDRDITIRTVAASHNPIDMKASDIMTTNIATIRPQMSIEECFDVMEDKDIRRVLVVDDAGRCCGIVAQADIVQSSANPMRTNEVIREISEAEPSRRRGISMSGRLRNYASHSGDGSFMSSGTLYPLLIGMGSGAALMYLLHSRQNGGKRTVSLATSTYPDERRMDTAGRQDFGKYADAEHEVEKRQQELQDRLHSARTEMKTPATGLNSPAIDHSEPFDQKDKPQKNNKGRSAGQSG